jgi:imidazolonepropionase-like amidohydrolase
MIGPRGGYGQKLVSTPKKLTQTVEDECEAGVDLIKLAMEDGYAQRQNLPLFTDEEVTAIVTEAHARGRRVSAHVTDAQFLPAVLDASVDDIAHIQWNPVSDALIAHLVEQDVYVVPTLTVLEAYGALSGAQSNLRRFVDAGVPIALGNDYTRIPQNNFDHFDLGMPMHEIQRMSEAGITPMQIIVAATHNAAHVCGLENDLGTLEAGKAADVLVVDGDPLQDLQALENVRLVIHNGVIIRDERPASASGD